MKKLEEERSKMPTK